MKKMSLQWRLTCITTLCIAIICGCLTMFVYKNGVYYMDSLQKAVDAQGDDSGGGSEEIYISIPEDKWDEFSNDFSVQVYNNKEDYRKNSLIISALLAILGGVATYFISGHALKPLREFSDKIEEVQIQNLADSRIEESKIKEFEEKPEKPSSNLASMGIYIFSWPVLKEALIKLKDQPNCDFGKHIIPYCHEKGDRLFAYEYNGYWKDVGTLSSYWEANMELIDIIPEFNLYEEFWKIYTNSANIPPQYIAENAVVDRCIIANGTEIYGEVHSSVLGGSVTVGKGSVVRDSIIMQGVTIGENCVIEKAIIAEDTVIGNDVSIGIGSEVPNKMKPNIYSGGLATIGENSVIPGGVQIGKNTAISGVTSSEDYIDGVLASGETLIKAGDRV